MRIIDDPAQNRTIYQVSGLFTKVSSDDVGPYGNLSLRVDMYVAKSSNDSTLYLKVLALSSKGWRVALGDTLALTIDNSRSITTCSGLVGAAGEKGVKMNQVTYYFTGGWYQINKPLLRTMANAKSVEVQIHTSAGIVPVELSESNLAELRKFQEKYVQ